MTTDSAIFDKYSPEQEKALLQYADLLREWNEKINLVSRKDTENIEKNHIFPALSISQILDGQQNKKILDVGTGGGIPGIPLAIMHPECSFHLVDSIGKKIGAVTEMAKSLGLRNVTAEQVRVENMDQRFDFVVGRGVTAMPRFIELIRGRLKKNGRVLYLKGGEIDEDIAAIGKKRVRVHSVSEMLDAPWLDDKCVLEITP